MEEPTEEIPDNLPETKVSRVAENVKEEDIEIITKTTNIVVHSESSHMESSYVSTHPISLMEDQQTSTTTGETTREESGTKKVVRFDEKTEFVPQGDREESYESETKDRDADAEIQHVESTEKSQTEDAVDAKEEFVAAANIPLEEEAVVSVSSEVMEAAEFETELPTPKQDVDESDKHSADSPRVETVEEATANVPEESETVNETSKPELDTLKEKETAEVEETQEKSKELDEHLEPFEELLDGPLEEYQPIRSSVKELKSSSKKQQAQIQDESLKEQLHGIIHEIDLEVNKEDEGTARRHHTWKPKGVYKVEKTEIKFEDIVPIKVDDVKIEDHPKEEPPKEKETKDEHKKGIKVEVEHNFDHYIQGEPSPISKLLRHCLINGEVLSPTDIPIGIPLLAKILPKEGEEDHEKIPLERLFTPASDWEEIIPHKKKAYASSCFYRPDHPTIDDQVELAHKISTSLVDETNKTSKGQTMYIKRKNRSAKWIHQGEKGIFEDSAASQYDMDDNEDAEENQTKEKPPLKLVVNKKIAQDYSLIQHHYEELLSTSQTLQQISNMEVGKEIASDLQSPTGKGAALFAKRKKRMDKFIIDETTVQQQQQPQSFVHEDTKSSTTTSTTTTVNNYQTSAFESKCSSQNQKQFNSSRLQIEPAMAAPSVTKTAPIQTGGLMLPDLVDILTKPKPIEKKTPSLAERGISKKKTSRSLSADSYKTTSGFQNQQFSQSQSKQTKKISANQMIHNGPDGQLYNASSFAGHELEALDQFTNGIIFQDPLENLRPGSPPTYMIPNGLESFVEHKIDHSTPQSVNGTFSSMVTSNNGIEKISNEAVEHATNSVSSGVHPLIANQAQAKAPSKLETFSSSEPSKHDLKHAYNLSSSFPITIRPEQGIKPERPNSLPVIPLANCSNPGLSSFYSASHNSIDNTNISQLGQTTLKNCLANKFSTTTSFLDYQNLENVKPVSIVNVLNEKVDPKEILMTPVFVLSKNADKPESPLIEPSWSDMTVFLDSVPFNTLNNQSVTELSKLSTCYNNTSSTNDSCISKVDFSPLHFNSFINYPKPFKSPTQDYCPVIDTSQTNFLPLLHGTKEFAVNDKVTTLQRGNASKFNTGKGAKETQFKHKNVSTLSNNAIDVLPNIYEETSEDGFIDIQRSSSAIHKTDDLRQIIQELDNMIELDAKLHNNFSDKIYNPELENENIILNLDDELTKFSNKSRTKEIEIKVQRTDSLVNEDELDDFISEIERSFSTTPTILESICIQDLQPLEFYRSVSPNSTNDDETVNDSARHHINDQTNDMGTIVNENKNNENYEAINNYGKHIVSSPINNPSIKTFDAPVHSHKNNIQNQELHFSQDIDDPLLVTNTLHNTTILLPIVSDSFHSRNQSTKSILNATQTEGSTRHLDINMSPWSTECGAIYTAEVKVIQKPSPIPTSSIISYSAPTPQHTILSDLASIQEKDKRKSFNLAPKGWGTYNTYYTPVHLGAP